MPPTLVVANVLLGDDAVLLGLRSDCMKWEFPGGKVEDDGVIGSFHRELMEETGMETKNPPALCGFSEERGADGKFYFTLYFVTRNWIGFPQLMEPEKCLAWRWFPYDSLPPAENCTDGANKFLRGVLPEIVKAITAELEARKQEDEAEFIHDDQEPATSA